MKLIIFLLINVIIYAQHPNGLFQIFKNQHGKIYRDRLEEERRFLIFQANLKKIEELNLKQMGGPDVEFGINQFADMTENEFIDKVLMNPTQPMNFNEERYLKSPNIQVPETFDWREKGAVSDIKDQGSSGTCWAFSTTGNIEGVNFLKTGKLTRVSEEQLVDCDGTQDVELKRADCGVFGGWPYLAFQYIIKAGGIDPEEEYPYCVGGGTYEKSCFPCMAPGWTEELCGPPVAYCDDKKWPCKSERSQNAIKINDWAAINTDENEIAQHLVTTGPLSVGLNASMLQFYRKGIFNPWFCDPKQLNHAVLMVGYGKDSKGKEFWAIKNSWGNKWGENGYFRIIRNKGKCGINTIAATAII